MTKRSNTIPIPQNELWVLLISTTRYAMGRMSSVVSDCTEMLQRYGRELEPYQRAQIAREIREELDRCERHGETLGMLCDHRQWQECAAKLEAMGE